MRRNFVFVPAVLGAALFQGCSYMTVLRTQEIQAVKDSLRKEIVVLQKQIIEGQQTQNELLRLIRADQQVRFGELEKKVTDLDSRISENIYRLSKIDEKTADFQKRLEEKFTADSAAAQSKKAEVQKLFQIANGDFTAGRFDIAMSGFKDLMVRFPDSPEAQEAQYWLGECNYAKKIYGEAETNYILYIKQNPHGSKLCASLYKLGLCYEGMRKTQSKTVVWKKLLDQCPGSEEARLVKSRVKQAP